jgi:Pvc16 N-terminal domain
MSTYQAVAAVTAAFAHRITQSIAPMPGAHVSTERPTGADPGGTPRVNLFLYHIDANPFLTTGDLPTRRADGTFIQKPRMGLDLFYLLTFYGNDKLPALESHLLAGLTLSGIHARPILTRDELSLFAGDAFADTDFVALTPLPMSIHELSRLWSMFFQVPYTLSISLKASAAILVSEPPVTEALPVTRRGLIVTTFDKPQIESVQAPAGSDQPLVFGGEMLVSGRGFEADQVVLYLGSTLFTPDRRAVTRDRILLPLTDRLLRAGVLPLRLVKDDMFEAVWWPVTLRPVVNEVRVTAAARDLTLTIALAPDIDPQQSVQVLLNEIDPPAAKPPLARVLEVPPVTANTGTITLPLPALPGGTYLVRVRVDRAESLLMSHPRTGRFSGPKIKIGTGR